MSKPPPVPTFTIGQKMRIIVSGEEVEAIYKGWDDAYGGGVFEHNGDIIKRKIKDETGAVIRTQPHHIETAKFSIEQRFQMMEEFIDMTIRGKNNALTIAGEGGLGKSYGVIEQLNLAGKTFIEVADDDTRSEGDVDMIKGFTTAKALYRSLYENKDAGKIIVLDDCDSALKDADAINILKAALDSYDKRIVAWNAEQRGENTLPRRFEFKGKVIFCTNFHLGKVPQPILSRCIYVDVDMTVKEKFARMRMIAPKINIPEVSLPERMKLIDFLETIGDEIGDLNMRTFIKSCIIVHQFPTGWKPRVEYLVTAY